MRDRWIRWRMRRLAKRWQRLNDEQLVIAYQIDRYSDLLIRRMQHRKVIPFRRR